MKLEEIGGCAYHKPKNAIVNLKTGAVVPKEVLDRIPDSETRRKLFDSHGMCEPCMGAFIKKSPLTRKEEERMRAAGELP